MFLGAFQTEGTSSLGCHGQPYEAGDNCSLLPLLDSTFLCSINLNMQMMLRRSLEVS